MVVLYVSIIICVILLCLTIILCTFINSRTITPHDKKNAVFIKKRGKNKQLQQEDEIDKMSIEEQRKLLKENLEFYNLMNWDGTEQSQIDINSLLQDLTSQKGE